MDNSICGKSVESMIKQLVEKGIFEANYENGKLQGYDYTSVFREYLIRFLDIHGSECNDYLDFFIRALRNFDINETDIHNIAVILDARSKIIMASKSFSKSD